MSTSSHDERGLPAAPDETAFVDAVGGARAMPDPALIAQMAQQFFGQLAGAAPQAPTLPLREGSDPRGLANVPLSPPALPASPSFPAASMPPANFDYMAPLAAVPSVGSMPTQSAVPMSKEAGSIASMDSLPWMPQTAGPWFSFLEDARSLASVDEVSHFETGGLNPQLVSDFKLAPHIFDVSSVRRDFPILQERVHGRPLIWLDNAATTQKPQAVIDRLAHFYAHENSNIHRAAHVLAARATDAYEAAREKVRRFLNARSTREIVFVRGATEAINLVAQSFGRRYVEQGDEVVITWLEHHANIVPWQMLCAEKGARLRVAPVDDNGQVILEEYEKLLGPRTRIVSFAHVSNALGTVTPAGEMIAMAHRHGARVLVDGAQAVSHMGVDVQALDCDWYVFSGHKIFAPTGIGVLMGKADLLDSTPPWQGGGNMIADVTFEKTIYREAPLRFEAGTGNIADAVGLGAALDYLERLGMDNIARHEHELLEYATAGLRTIPGLRLIGTARDKAGVLSFVLDGFRTEDVGAALDREGIAVRSGHHCAQPILRRFGQETSVRPSLALYNTCEDVDALIAALRRLTVGRKAGSTFV